MVTQNMAPKKASFLAEIFMTCDTPSVRSLPILVLSNKTEYMRSSKKIYRWKHLSHHMSSHNMMSKRRAYLCFIIKTKHMLTS
jgi:hypothetical protein